MIYPTIADILSVCPKANKAIVTGIVSSLPTVGAAGGLTSIARVAHFLGQAGVETDHFLTYEEYASGAAYEGRHDLGNTHAGDGRRFKGRGAFDLTGRANYAAATTWVANLMNRPSLDLVATPEIVAADKAVGLATSLWFWKNRKLNVFADTGVNDTSIEHITHVINGGYNGLHERARLTYAFYKVLVNRQAHAVVTASKYVNRSH